MHARFSNFYITPKVGTSSKKMPYPLFYTKQLIFSDRKNTYMRSFIGAFPCLALGAHFLAPAGGPNPKGRT